MRKRVGIGVLGAGLLAALLLPVLRPASAAATRYEAENATRAQAAVATNHLNYSGSGFVDYANLVGSSVEWTVNAASAGTATLVFGYANGSTVDRPMDITVNGTLVASGLAFNPTANWDTWRTNTVTAAVNAGTNTVRATATTTSGGPNVDYLDFSVAPAGSEYQAEDATLSQAVVATNHLNYTGTGFVDYNNVVGSYVEFTVTAATAGTYDLTFRYCNASTISNRPMDITVNGSLVGGNMTFDTTGPNWDTWGTKTVTVTLNAGSNKVRATSTTTSGGPNLDKLTIGAATSTPSPTTTATPTFTPTSTASPTPTPTSTSGGPAVPFGSHQFGYVAGTLKPTGAQATLDTAVVYYYGRWKAAFVRQNCGNGWYEVISPDADHPYVAEGQGYGMVVIATMAGADPNAKTVFDGMVKYMLAHPSVNNADLLAAEQDTSCRSVNGSDSATDGDLDVAFGLLLADRQWGSAGTYNYKQLAIKHINAIKANEVNPTTHLMLLGDWSTCCDGLYWTTRPSDHMLDHFRAFKAATGDSTWDTVRTAHQNLITNLQNQYAASTGLLPDFVVTTNTTPKPAPGMVLEDANDGKYWWNSCRTPWRIGTDAITGGGAASLSSAQKINSWIKSKTAGNPNSVAVGYTLAGTAISAGSESAFFAPFAVTAMTDPSSQAWLDGLWSKMLNTTFASTDYYSTSIQLQVMIVASGNYWVP